MKLVQVKHGDRIKVCLLDADGRLRDLTPCGVHSMREIWETGDYSRLERACASLPVLDEGDIAYLPPVLSPSKVICVGLNYQKHIEEMKHEVPAQPVFFAKFANAIAAHREELRITDKSPKLDYEAELVVIIGKTCKNVSQEQARSYCFGYTCGNDVSARDLQAQSSQWTLGKACDQFAPIGPVVVTADAIDPDRLAISTTVNGRLRQSDTTAEMLFSPDFLVSYLSRYITLEPGDLIFTGTPKGVGNAMPEENRRWLRAGDVVEVSIEGIGTLSNTIAD